MAERYRAADLFTLPSSAEAFGNVFAEALASGLPIVRSTTGGIPDLVEHGSNGLLVTPGDVNALAGAIRYLANDPELRAEMALRVSFWLAVDAARTFAALDLDAESVDGLARRRLGRLLSHSAWSNTFYGRRFQDAGIEGADPILQSDPYRALAALPPASKLELRQAGSKVLAGGRVDPRWLSSASSGSTGEPFRVYYEPPAPRYLRAETRVRRRVARRRGQCRDVAPSPS